jgi:hypothetical protein
MYYHNTFDLHLYQERQRRSHLFQQRTRRIRPQCENRVSLRRGHAGLFVLSFEFREQRNDSSGQSFSPLIPRESTIALRLMIGSLMGKRSGVKCTSI